MTTKIFYSNSDFEKDIIELTRQMALDNWKPDLIVGLTRGGLIPAVYLSQFYDVRMEAVNLSLRDFKTNPEDIVIKDLLKYERILIVDDIIDSGETVKIIRESLIKQYTNQWLKTRENEDHTFLLQAPIKVATCFYNKTNRFHQKPNYFAREMNKEVQSQNYWVNFFYEMWWKQND